MCLHGLYKEVRVINPYQNKKIVVIDACIADEIQELNTLGVITLACCCGHGKAGKISEWKNEFGSWKAHELPPHVFS
ncbi:hypothetical protein HRF87_27650 [Bacillus sp. CRN 9]|nr:hypothetical protein [Bacillus sp. CRN 9]